MEFKVFHFIQYVWDQMQFLSEMVHITVCLFPSFFLCLTFCLFHLYFVNMNRHKNDAFNLLKSTNQLLINIFLF